MNRQTGRGGPGRGQGRKPEHTERMRSYRVTLDEHTVEEAKRIGKSISKGIRIAVAAMDPNNPNWHGGR